MHKQIHLPNSHINESTKRATYKVGHIPRWTGGHLLLDADPHPGTRERNTGGGTGSGYVPMFKTGMKYIHVTSNIVKVSRFQGLFIHSAHTNVIRGTKEIL